jgi:hypothetical protein
MRLKSILAAGVGLTFCALAAGASAQRSGDWGADILGDWRAQHTGSGGSAQSCDISLTDKDWFGAFKASSFACSGDLFGVDRYRVEGDTVALVGAGGQAKVKLRLRGDRLTGIDSQGREVTLTRKGAPPSLPAGGGWSGGDCVRHGESERCATEEEQRPPQLRLITTYNLRRQADPDASVVLPLRKGSCVAVSECRHLGYDLWCRVRSADYEGWLPQVTRRDDGRVLVFKSGC